MTETTTKKSIIRVIDAAEKCGVHRCTIHNWTNPKSDYYRADFPKKIKLSENSVGFFEHEIDAYLDALAQGLIKGQPTPKEQATTAEG